MITVPLPSDTKLEQQLVDRHREIAAVKMKYSEISAKLQRETVETRQQLKAAEQVASGLSDQLKVRSVGHRWHSLTVFIRKPIIFEIPFLFKIHNV